MTYAFVAILVSDEMPGPVCTRFGITTPKPHQQNTFGDSSTKGNDLFWLNKSTLHGQESKTNTVYGWTDSKHIYRC